MISLITDLNNHIKIFDVRKHGNTIICEIDRIQSVARSIAKRITVHHGNFTVKSTTKDVKHLGFTKIIIERV